MNVEKTRLMSIASRVGISEKQAEKLWSGLKATEKELPKKNASISTILYYAGAFFCIAGMSWFMRIGWDQYGGLGIMSIALLSATFFFTIGSSLWRKASFKTPAGLFITVAVCMTPMAIFGFQAMMGWIQSEHDRLFTDWIKDGWFLRELGTVLVGSFALYYYRFPFLTAPIFLSLWLMSMDVASSQFDSGYSRWQTELVITMIFGLALILVAYFIDRKTQEDFAFWGYLFGMLAFWTSLTWFVAISANIWLEFTYCLLNVGLLLLSVLLQRTTFLIFGALGLLFYFGFELFDSLYNSTLYPLVLSLLGLAIVFLGILYSKHLEKIEHWIFNHCPKSVLNFLPKRK